MAFYKRDGEELLTAPNFVRGPGFDLFAETHGQNQYPVDGWYWFDTLDEAMRALAAPAAVTQISMYQARLRLLQMGALSAVESAISTLPEPDQTAARIGWDYAPYIERSHQIVVLIKSALGWSDAHADEFFATASAL